MAPKLPVYLDNNATTPLDPRVISVMRLVLETEFGNPASTTHSLGWSAEELVRVARENVAALINAAPEEIVFTSGATEANNLALKGFAECCTSCAPENIRFIAAATEHKSVLDPLHTLASRGYPVKILPVSKDGFIDPGVFSRALETGPAFVSLMLANNEIGTVQDIQTLIANNRKRIVYFHCDATQAAGKIPVDVTELGADLLSFSAHKLHGPKGAGALYIRRRNPLLRLHAQLEGGGHEYGFRSGTLNVPGIVGFGEACRIAKTELDQTRQHLNLLSQMLLTQIQDKIPGVKLNGSPFQRLPGNLSLAIDGIDNSRLIGLISTKLAMSISSACQSASPTPSHVLKALGLSEAEQRSTIRIGIGRFNTEEEIYYAAEILTGAVNKIRTERASINVVSDR